ncbi:MAG: insulinase family protein, partial [Saprospiraceae bacterium]|nr:insulinase family protein [Saprospiraceae bacterium]
ETIANKLISESMFGGHVYGQTTESSNVAQLRREHVIEHYAMLGSGNLSVFLSGQVRDDHLQLVESACGRLRAGSTPGSYDHPEPQDVRSIRVKGPQTFQAAIRIGRQVIERRHPDFPALFLLNTVLGGFFGARLMHNIREKQGLTYGIYSTLETLVKGACLIISTEAAVDKTERVIGEIHKEIVRLQNAPVPEQELEMVRNYLMGTLLMQLDGPLRSMDMIKTMIMESLDDAYFHQFVRDIRETSAGDVQRVAQQYLDLADLNTAVVG